ncbi:MAG: PKD domain-containing protein [Opitutaceae bacterium]|nr:PKD domain-containing protein [Cytophagales bacterium]
MKKDLIIISVALLAVFSCKKKTHDLPSPEAAQIKTTQLDENSFVFENVTPTGGGASKWDFGGIVSSIKQKDTVFFGSVGTYDIKLTSNSKGGISSTSTQVTVVKSSPLSDFTISKAASKNSFVINSSTPGNISYRIEYSNGEILNTDKDTVYLPWQGQYTATLTVKANYGGRVVTSISKQTIDVASDDSNNPMLTDPVYLKLTGGLAQPNGKTWVMSPTAKLSGVGPYIPNAINLDYYNYPTGYDGDAAWKNGALQNEYTFVMKGYQYIPKNNTVTMHWAFANEYFNQNQAQYSDIALPDPKHAQAPFVLRNENIGVTGYTLKFGNESYIAYFDGRYNYEIAKITNDSLWIRHKYSDGPKDDPAKDGNQRVLLFTVKK